MDFLGFLEGPRDPRRMSRPLRLEHQGAFWHVTSRGNEKRDIFRDDGDRLLFLSLLGATIRRFRWVVHAYVLMNNHFHLVFQTPEPTLSRGMHWLKGTYAQRFNRKYKRCGHLFQGRFQGILVEEQGYLNEVRRYTVLNPVRAGMVEDPGQYLWSSYRAHAGLEPIPEWLASEWIFELDRERERCHQIYREYVMARVESKGSIWEGLVGQIYFGGEEWIGKMRKLVESKPRSREHPRGQRLIPRLKMGKIVRAVARVCKVEERELERGHGGVARKLAAWIGWNEGLLRLTAIAVALRLRSSGYISTLIRQAESELARDELMRRLADQAITQLKNG